MRKSTSTSIIVVIVLVILTTIATLLIVDPANLYTKRSESQSANLSTDPSIVPSNEPSASMVPTIEFLVESVFAITVSGTCISTAEIVEALLSIIENAVPSPLYDSGASFVITKTESSCDSLGRRQLMVHTVAVDTITYIIVAQIKLGGDDLIEAIEDVLLGKNPSSGVTVNSIGLIKPSDAPSLQPSLSMNPSAAPSDLPSVSDVPSISASPTTYPSLFPSESHSPSTSLTPSRSPTTYPSLFPTRSASQSPSTSLKPSRSPTTYPSLFPTRSASQSPSNSLTPSQSLTTYPSLFPTRSASQSPSESPSTSQSPSTYPSESQSPSTSLEPTTQPSLFPSHIDTWKQLGDDIIGEAIGSSLSLSKDGSVLAVGGKTVDKRDNVILGRVRVFKLSGEEWIQRGDDFDGVAVDLGVSVALSADGSVVSMGAPGDGLFFTGRVRIYKWEGGAWTQKGIPINGEAYFDNSGYSMTLNHDGNVIGIGASGNDGNGNRSGHVRVFEFVDGSWDQRGQDIDGENAEDTSGQSISLDSSGSTVAIGARWNGGNGYHSGHVRVYAWDLASSRWVQKGADIDGKSPNEWSGQAVSLNDAGTVVAIGTSPRYTNTNTKRGKAMVYEWSNEEGGWIQRGDTFVGAKEYAYLGSGISLNGSGDTVAIGARGVGDNAQGSVYVFEWDRLTLKWNLKVEIRGGEERERFGSRVSISADALTLAVGAHDYGDGEGGVSRIYKWS